MRLNQLICLTTIFVTIVSCGVKHREKSPSIFLVKEKTQGFTSAEDLRNIDINSHQGKLWNDFIGQAENDLKLPYIDPTTDFEGRSPVHLKHKNVSYDMARGVCERLSRSALLFMVTEEEKYKKLVLQQIEALYDTTRWPMWCDDAHVNKPPHVDIRTFRISMWVALCYNWMKDDLSKNEKKFIIDGLDKRAIQPFWEKLAQRPGWYTHRHNWFTNMFGGMGITAMALGDAHPETLRLLDTIVPEMIDFNDSFGIMGEFNEPPGYAGAVRFSVEFAEAYRYYTKNKRNLLAEKPFPDVCYWIMYHTLPPGRMMPFGDTNTDQPLSSPAVIAAAANANKDGILQWYYLQYFTEMKSPMELFWFNPEVKPEHPEGKLPLGIEYKEHGAELISRTSWDPKITHCVIYGKAGRETNHDDNDVGQLCIDGFGEALIIDPGKPKPIYPKDYFGKTQYNYYTRSSKGHNVLVIGDKEMKSEPNSLARGKTIKSWFNDSIGSYWEINSTPVYENVLKVTRKVAHLFPGIIVVHDYAELAKEDSIDLRWHCVSTPHIFEPFLGIDGFTTRNSRATLSARIISLNENFLKLSSGNHEFKPPYNLTRQGDPLEQHYEPFVKISTKGKIFSTLSLFAVFESSTEEPIWEESTSGWELYRNGVTYTVTAEENSFKIISSSGKSILMN